MESKAIGKFGPLKVDTRRLRTAGRWIFIYVVIGVLAGVASIVFNYLCQLGMHLFLDQMAGFRPPASSGDSSLFTATQTPHNRWILLFLPSLGGLIGGWLVYTFAPETAGGGIDPTIDAYHNQAGFIRGRVPFIKTFASVLTITTGGSGGREGPISQIGAGLGSYLGTRLKLTDRERRIMLAAGMGAGVGSIFRAPLAGALFAAEVLYRDPEFESEVIIPAGIASVVAYCSFCLVFGWGSLFRSENLVFQNPLELIPYIVLAFVVVGGGILYVKCFYGMKRLFNAIRVPNHVKPAIGGLCTGAVGFFLPQTLAFGYGYAQMAIEGQLPILFLLGLALGKILTTSFSIGSGGSGGLFGPSIIIGGAFGGIVGKFFHALMPGVVTQPAAFVIVGMGGFFTAVSTVPISTIIFVSETTNSYYLLLPSLLVCSLSYLLSRKWAIYENQVRNKLDSKAHRGDFFVDVLETIQVKELLPHVRQVQLIPEEMTFRELREVFASTQQHYFPVVNRERKLTGIFSINDVRGVLFEEGIGDLVLMRDVANVDIIYTTPSEDLNEALKKFTIRNLHRLPVVRDEDHTTLIGMLDRKEVIEFYNQRVLDLKASRKQKEPYDREITLRNAKVRDAVNRRAEVVLEGMKLDEIEDLFRRSKFKSFPVLNSSGLCTGILSFSDYGRAVERRDPSLTARDIATAQVVTVTEEETLFSALHKFTSGDFAILPVVDPGDRRRLVGVIGRRDIMTAINDAVVRKRTT
jgi:chloride channel protein, CIC family